MRVYMNNLHSRPHASLYGPNAFFDLNCTGRQAAMALGLNPGQECIVASCQDAAVVFKTYVLEFEEVRLPAGEEAPCRAFFGMFQDANEMSKVEAGRSTLYAPFFDKLGRFKRQSAFIWPAKK